MNLMVGQKAPDFNLPGHLGNQVRLSDLCGKNVVLVFFPLAWTPVWTNQIPSYEAQQALFTGLNAQVLGISVDHIPCLQSWAESLGGITYPLLSDFWPHGAVAERYDVLRQNEGISERAIFVLDRDGVIRYIDVHDIADQPDNDEIFNVLRQLENEERPIDPGMLAISSGVYFEPEEEVVEVEEETPRGSLVVYCARWCKDCKKAKTWLDERGLVYEEIDIDYDFDARSQVRKWANGFLITPTFKIEETIVLDFDAPKLEEALRKSGILQ